MEVEVVATLVSWRSLKVKPRRVQRGREESYSSNLRSHRTQCISRVYSNLRQQQPVAYRKESKEARARSRRKKAFSLTFRSSSCSSHRLRHRSNCTFPVPSLLAYKSVSCSHQRSILCATLMSTNTSTKKE